MLVRKRSKDDEQALKVTAVLLSWGIYGASVEWRRNRKTVTPEEMIKSAIPFIKHGLDFT
ncbi:hypothetical protein [Ferdinandcohnia sp. Marseille-Q9671]